MSDYDAIGKHLRPRYYRVTEYKNCDGETEVYVMILWPWLPPPRKIGERIDRQDEIWKPPQCQNAIQLKRSFSSMVATLVK